MLSCPCWREQRHWPLQGKASWSSYPDWQPLQSPLGPSEMRGRFFQERHSGLSVATSLTHPTRTYGTPTVYPVLEHSRANMSPSVAQGYQQRAKRGTNVGPGLGNLGRLLGEGQDIHAGILKYELGLAGVVRGRK